MTAATATGLDLEIELLGHMLDNNDLIEGIATRLTPEVFSDAALGIMFETMVGLRNEGRPITRITLGELMSGNPLGDSDLDRIGSAMLRGKPEELLDALLNRYRRRQIADAVRFAEGAIVDPKTKPADILARTMGELDRIAADMRPARRTNWTAADGIGDMLANIADSEKDYIPSGIAAIDRIMGGYRRGDLLTGAARPSMGKTALAVAMGNNVARRKVGVLAFSLEMSKDAWLARATSEHAYRTLAVTAPYSEALRNALPAAAKEGWCQAAAAIRRFPLVIEERAGLTIDDIRRLTRQAAINLERQGTPLGLVFVDYIGIVRAADRYRGNRVMEVAEITAGLKALAKAENCAVVAFHQINRNVEQRDNKRPLLSDLRESGAVEQDSDIVMFPFRYHYYLRQEEPKKDPLEEATRLQDLTRTEHEIEINIAKFRQGETTTVKLWCDMAVNAFIDLHPASAKGN